MANGQESGVWGGTSEDERRALRHLRRGSARPGAAEFPGPP